MANFFATLDADTRVEFIQILKDLKDLNNQSVNTLKEMSHQFLQTSGSVTESQEINSIPAGVDEDAVELPSVFYEEGSDLIIPSYFSAKDTPTLVDAFSSFNKEENNDLNDSYEKSLKKFHCVDDFHLHLGLTNPLFDRGKCDVLPSYSSEKPITPSIPKFGYESDLGFLHSIRSLCGNDANILGEGNLFKIMPASLIGSLTDGDVCFYFYLAYNCWLFDPGGYAVKSSISYEQLIFPVIINLGYASVLRVIDSIVILCDYVVTLHVAQKVFVKNPERNELLLPLWVKTFEHNITQELLAMMFNGVARSGADVFICFWLHGFLKTTRIRIGKGLAVTTGDENVWKHFNTNNRIQSQVLHCEQIDIFTGLLNGKELCMEGSSLHFYFTCWLYDPGKGISSLVSNVCLILMASYSNKSVSEGELRYEYQLFLSAENLFVLVMVQEGVFCKLLYSVEEDSLFTQREENQKGFEELEMIFISYKWILLIIGNGNVIMGCCHFLFDRGKMLESIVQYLYSRSPSDACSRVFQNLDDHTNTNDYGWIKMVASNGRRE